MPLTRRPPPLNYQKPSRTKDAAAFVAKAIVCTVLVGIWLPIVLHDILKAAP